MKKLFWIFMFAFFYTCGMLAAPESSSGNSITTADYFPLVAGRHYRYQEKKSKKTYDAVVSLETTIMGDEVYKIYFSDFDYAIYLDNDEVGFRMYQETPEDGYSEAYAIPITFAPGSFKKKDSSKKLYTYQGHDNDGLLSVGATSVVTHAMLKKQTVALGDYMALYLQVKTVWEDHDGSKGNTMTVLYGAKDIGIIRIIKKANSNLPGKQNLKINIDLSLVEYWDE
jgi:hypothetical protein